MHYKILAVYDVGFYFIPLGSVPNYDGNPFSNPASVEFS